MFPKIIQANYLSFHPLFSQAVARQHDFKTQ